MRNHPIEGNIRTFGRTCTTTSLSELREQLQMHSTVIKMKKASFCYSVSIVMTVVASLLVLHKLSGILDDLQDIAPQPRQQPLPSVTPTNTATNFHSAIRFVFVMGLEGTGHHTVGALIHDSPATQRLQQLGIHPNKTLDLALSLYSHRDSSGLWNAHCKGTTATGAFSYADKDGGEGNDNKKSPNKQAIKEPDTSKYIDKVVETLRTINDIAKDSNTKDPIALPINTWTPKDAKLFRRVGQISYPNFGSYCRKLNYPNLDLLYQACNRAHVDCAHVYIYRDPMAIIRSTDRRFGHATILGAIHLYTSLLAIMHMQLYQHGPQTAGCWGLLDASQDSNWKLELSQMFGWKSQLEFQSMLDKNFKQPKPMSDESKNQLFATNTSNPFGPYLESFYHIHNDVIAMCQEQHSRYLSNWN